MIFAAFMPRAGYLRDHCVLAERVEEPRFFQMTSFSPRNHLHEFDLRNLEQLNTQLRELIEWAYRVGGQEHLGRGPQR